MAKKLSKASDDAIASPDVASYRSETEWREANPIRVWRRENQTSRPGLVAAAGISMTTIINMEAGDATPKALAKVAKVMGWDDEEMDVAWLKWLRANPVRRS
jgi:hypothetical protein